MCQNFILLWDLRRFRFRMGTDRARMAVFTLWLAFAEVSVICLVELMNFAACLIASVADYFLLTWRYP